MKVNMKRILILNIRLLKINLEKVKKWYRLFKMFSLLHSILFHLFSFKTVKVIKGTNRNDHN